MDLIGLNDLPEPVKEMLLGQLEEALGLTPERAVDFLEKSEKEGIEKDLISDATGDFKHFLRTGHHWQGAVDVLWPAMEPMVRSVVEAVEANRKSEAGR